MKEIIYIKFKGKRGITYSSMYHNYWKEFISVKAAHTDILWLFRICQQYARFTFSCVTFKVYIVNPEIPYYESLFVSPKGKFDYLAYLKSLNQSRENSYSQEKINRTYSHKLSSVGTQQPAVRDASYHKVICEENFLGVISFCLDNQ